MRTLQSPLIGSVSQSSTLPDVDGTVQVRKLPAHPAAGCCPAPCSNAPIRPSPRSTILKYGLSVASFTLTTRSASICASALPRKCPSEPRSGEVGCKSTTRDYWPVPCRSRCRTRCSIYRQLSVQQSPASSTGLKYGTVAPAARATAAISASSVDTYTASIAGQARACCNRMDVQGFAGEVARILARQALAAAARTNGGNASG
jgi:hypothetical protein